MSKVMSSDNSFTRIPIPSEKRASLCFSDTTAHYPEEGESGEELNFHSPLLSPISATQLLGTLAYQPFTPSSADASPLPSRMCSTPSKRSSTILPTGSSPRASLDVLGLYNNFEEEYEKADWLCEELDLSFKLNEEGLTNLEKDQRTLSSALKALDQMCVMEQQKFKTLPSLGQEQIGPVAIDLSARLFYILEQYQRFSNYFFKASHRLSSHKLSVLGNAYQTTKHGWQKCQRELAECRIQQAIKLQKSPSPLNSSVVINVELKNQVEDLTLLVGKLEEELESTQFDNRRLRKELSAQAQASVKTKACLEAIERSIQEIETSSSSPSTFSTPLQKLECLKQELKASKSTFNSANNRSLSPPILRRHEELMIPLSTEGTSVGSGSGGGGGSGSGGGGDQEEKRWDQVFKARELENKELRAQVETLSTELRRESNKAARIMGKLETLQQLTDECFYGSNGFSVEQALRMVSSQLIFLLKDAAAANVSAPPPPPLPIIKNLSSTTTTTTTTNAMTIRTLATPTRTTTMRLASPRIIPLKSPRGEKSDPPPVV